MRSITEHGTSCNISVNEAELSRTVSYIEVCAAAIGLYQ